jgi:hypothetical protein
MDEPTATPLYSIVSKSLSHNSICTLLNAKKSWERLTLQCWPYWQIGPGLGLLLGQQPEQQPEARRAEQMEGMRRWLPDESVAVMVERMGGMAQQSASRGGFRLQIFLDEAFS